MFVPAPLSVHARHLAGLGAFTSLVALALKPGTGTGKLLVELEAALQPMQRLQRLHLDLKSALQLQHVQAVAEACSSRLQHLSLNMRASNIGSKAIESIAQLSCLTSLQLLGTTAETLAGPPAAVALQSMQVRFGWLRLVVVLPSVIFLFKPGLHSGQLTGGLTG